MIAIIEPGPTTRHFRIMILFKGYRAHILAKPGPFAYTSFTETIWKPQWTTYGIKIANTPA